RDDQTIQKLYRIAKRIISPEIEKEETDSAAFEKLYFWAFNGLDRTKEILLGNQDIETTKEREIDCQDDHITALNEIHMKRFAATPPFNVSTMPNASTVSILISTRGTTRELKRQMQQKNWEFIDAYRAEHGSNMDWEQCFVQGKEKGLFQQYTRAKSTKAAYFRSKW
ncbi:hypothetical protein CLU79DRAFT_707957, partial [Phycomyces nitens]